VTVTSGAMSGSPTHIPNAHPFDYGKDLALTLTDGISVSSFAVSAYQATTAANVNGKRLVVTAITSTKVTLSGDLSNFVSPGTPVSFVGQSQGNVNLMTAPGYAIFTCSLCRYGEHACLPVWQDRHPWDPGRHGAGPGPRIVADGTKVTGADPGTLDISPALACLPANQEDQGYVGIYSAAHRP
jgi:hypothetical protein